MLGHASISETTSGQRIDERFKALRWGSTALWAFLIFFVQRYFGSVLEAPPVAMEGYQEALA